jgi:hypothetical protein
MVPSSWAVCLPCLLYVEMSVWVYSHFFPYWVVSLLVSFESSLYILHTNPVMDVWFATFSSSLPPLHTHFGGTGVWSQGPALDGQAFCLSYTSSPFSFQPWACLSVLWTVELSQEKFKCWWSSIYHCFSFFLFLVKFTIVTIFGCTIQKHK